MNRNIILRSVLLVAAVVLGVRSAHAEDIDLFVGSTPSTANLPNVLFIIDNTGNWTPPFVNEKAALVSTFTNMAVNTDGSAKFRVGVLFSAETGGANNNTPGGYIRAALRPMDAATKPIYAAMINAFEVNKDKSNGGDASLLMAEAYRYFSAGTPAGVPHAGNGKQKTDYQGNDTSGWSGSVSDAASRTAMQAVYALPGNALASKNATLYNAPTGTGCAKNFIIYVSNGAPQDNGNARPLSNQFLTEAGGAAAAAQISLSPAGSVENVSDEWARFMKTSSLGVTTYAIDVDPKSTGQGPGWTRLLKSMTEQSEGKYFTANSAADAGAQIANAVNEALAEILSVNTVFASVSLPVSVNTQGAYLNQVFIGMFRPDGAADPRWTGNLKQYRIGVDASKVRLEDSSVPAKSAIGLNGFIAECARSFWTPATADTYWSFIPPAAKQGGDCGAIPTGSGQYYFKDSNSPDGSVVEKGGQAYVLRQSTTRNIKTCSKTFANCNATTGLTNFEAANTDIDFPGVSAADRTSLIQWAAGLDVPAGLPPNVRDEDGDGVTTTEMRPSAHGDVVHSRPVALDFSTAAAPAPKVVVFYGGNDGVFRAVNGNRTASIGSAVAGKELWSFVAPESFSMLKRLKDNAPKIKFPNVVAADAQPKDYGLDGPVTAYQFSSGAYIYATMRRGGRAMYAFNVPASDPSNITLKWKLGCPNVTNDTDCKTGFEGIGQTWSSPKVLRAAGFGSGSAPLLMMGGGYDGCEDADPNTCSSSSKGRQVYVLDADTGALEKSFTTTRPVVADVAIAPDLVTGLAKYAYVVDTGGDVYRITIGNAVPAAWTMTKIASLGCATAPATCPGNRKFLFPPDLVEEDGGYSLLIGSGDREKPLRYGSGVSNAVANYFFKIQDKPLDSAWLSSEMATCGSEILCLQSLLAITSATPTEAQLDTKKGFYLALNSMEQVVTSAITIFGTVTFSTYEPRTPSVSSCSNDLGLARVYNIGLSDASDQDGDGDRFDELPPIGLPPSPTAGIVVLDDGTTRAYCFGCSDKSPLEAEEPVIPLTSSPLIPKSRVYWYVEQ